MERTKYKIKITLYYLTHILTIVSNVLLSLFLIAVCVFGFRVVVSDGKFYEEFIKTNPKIDKMFFGFLLILVPMIGASYIMKLNDLDNKPPKI